LDVLGVIAGLALSRCCHTIVAVAAEAFIQCRVAPTTKAALRAAADRQQLTETALLKRMLNLVLHTAGAPDTGAVTTADHPTRQARLYVRLTMGDRQLLQERSAARHMAAATYASNLLRAHLRSVTPLPEAELRALRQSTRELAAIGRNLNQIGRAVHQGAPRTGVGREDLRSLLKACEALRDHVRAYIRTNVSSWESSDAAPKS
jgi:hypothetical protein